MKKDKRKETHNKCFLVQIWSLNKYGGDEKKGICKNSEKVVLFPYRNFRETIFKSISVCLVKFSTPSLALSILASKHKKVTYKHICRK